MNIRQINIAFLSFFFPFNLIFFFYFLILRAKAEDDEIDGKGEKRRERERDKRSNINLIRVSRRLAGRGPVPLPPNSISTELGKLPTSTANATVTQEIFVRRAENNNKTNKKEGNSVRWKRLIILPVEWYINIIPNIRLVMRNSTIGDRLKHTSHSNRGK